MTQFAFWLLAAIDGHAKNFSIRLYAHDKYEMTPLYDVLSAWPILGNGPHCLPIRDAKMAMALRGNNPHYRMAEIQARHWKALAKGCGMPGVWGQMIAMANDIERAIGRVTTELPVGYPPEVAERILRVFGNRVSVFLNQSVTDPLKFQRRVDTEFRVSLEIGG